MEKFPKLRAKIVERGITQGQLAKAIGIEKSTLSAKMNGKTEFKLAEMTLIRMYLDLTPDEFYAVFFAD